MEKIGEILATSQPGHSQTSKKIDIKITCEKCNKEFDTSYWIKPDGTELKASNTCHECLMDERRQESIADSIKELEKTKDKQWGKWIEECGVTGKFLEKDFDNFNIDLQPKAVKAIKEYENHSTVLLSPGIYGVGKTHLVCALVNYLVNNEEPAHFLTNSYQIRTKHCPVYFTTEQKLLSRIRDTFNKSDDSETEEEVYKKIGRFPILIIDDVGKVRPKDLSFLQAVYFRIIDDRYINDEKIILTTNLDYSELEEYIGGASADRLREMCGKDGFIKMSGKSYRR